MLEAYLCYHLGLRGWHSKLEEGLEISIVIHGKAGHQIGYLKQKPVEILELAVGYDFVDHLDADQTFDCDECIRVKGELDSLVGVHLPR